MQIDFHHAVTYVVARWSGFGHGEASVIATAAQYVDDSTSDVPIQFEDDSTFERLATAHKMIDLSNLNAVADHVSWVPFHFLPGAQGDGDHALLCVQNSAVAQDMLNRCIADCRRPDGTLTDEALHRLGITAHVYVDTWAHQKFAGILSPVNGVTKVLDETGAEDEDFAQRRKDAEDSLLSRLIPDMGHGKALTLPDQPWLAWSYVNGDGQVVERQNLDLFVDAADHLYRFFRRFQGGEAVELDMVLKNELRAKFDTLRMEDGGARHAVWLKALADGGFKGIAPVEVTYSSNGPSSWEVAAFGAISIDPQYPTSPRPERGAAFETGHWKKFHLAAKAHQEAILTAILPAHGLQLET